MKNSFKKIALLCTALAMNVSAYAISTGGAVAAGFGSAAAIGLLAYGISKSNGSKKNKKNKKNIETENSSSFKERKVTSRSTKKQLKQDINSHKKELKEHKLALKKLEKKGKGQAPEAIDHKSMINKLESDVDLLKQKLQKL